MLDSSEVLTYLTILHINLGGYYIVSVAQEKVFAIVDLAFI